MTSLKKFSSGTVSDALFCGAVAVAECGYVVWCISISSMGVLNHCC